MKVLHLPLNVPGSEQVGQEKGFREVFDDYVAFDYLDFVGNYGNEYTNNFLYEVVKQHKPDVIWAQLQETNIIMPETWKRIRNDFPDIWLTTWSGDARTYVPPGLASILPYFDVFYNCTDQEELYRPYCKRYEFMPIAVDPDEVTTFKEVLNVPSIIFIGNHYGFDSFPNSRRRYEVMAALTKEFGNDFGVYGNGWPAGDVNLLGPVAVKDQGSYYHAAKVVISMDHFNDMCYWSERRLWALASGNPVVLEEHPESKAWFDRLTCRQFKTASDCILNVHRFLDGDMGMTDLLTQTARDRVLQHHTWTQRAQQVRRDYEDTKR